MGVSAPSCQAAGPPSLSLPAATASRAMSTWTQTGHLSLQPRPGPSEQPLGVLLSHGRDHSQLQGILGEHVLGASFLAAKMSVPPALGAGSLGAFVHVPLPGSGLCPSHTESPEPLISLSGEAQQPRWVRRGLALASCSAATWTFLLSKAALPGPEEEGQMGSPPTAVQFSSSGRVFAGQAPAPHHPGGMVQGP